MSETIQLDPGAVAGGRTAIDITSFSAASGIDWGDAAIAAYLADQQVGSSPVDYRIPNRQIKIPLSLRDVGATTFSSIRASLQAKVALFQREGGWIMRQVGSTALYADVVNATLHLGGSWLQAYRSIDVDAVLSLETLPDWYGDEVTLSDHVETTNPELIFTEAAVLGNHPGRVRIVVDNDDATNDQHGLLWGVRSRYYDSAATAKLAYQAEAMTPLNGAAGTALTGASGGSAVHIGSLPAGNWVSMLSTTLTAGSAPLTHRGTYRVWARCYSATGAPQFRFLWGVGGLSAPVTNAAVQLTAGSAFYLLDLGGIRLDPPPTAGTAQWSGVVQAQAATGSVGADIDRLWFQPLDESAGALARTSQPPASSISTSTQANTAADDATVGTIAWTNPGGARYQGDSSIASVSSAGVGDDSHYLVATNFGFTVPTGATIVGIAPALVRKCAGGGGGSVNAFAKLVKAGVIQSFSSGFGATWTTSWATETFGGPTSLWSNTWTASDINNSGFGVAVVAAVTLDTAYIDGISITIYYTLASGFTVAPDAVIYASRSTELRTEGMYRQNAGSVFGPVSQVIGDLPRIPSSGLENRTVEVFLKPSRGNLDGEPDSGIDDTSARVFYRPSYLYTGS